MGVPRSAVCDTIVGGFNVPKDTIVFVNQYAIHRDPKYFEDPEDFKPERWIKNGKVIKLESFVPFNGGTLILRNFSKHLFTVESAWNCH